MKEGRVVSPVYVAFVVGFVQTCKCNQTKVDAQASFDCPGWQCHPAVLIFYRLCMCVLQYVPSVFTKKVLRLLSLEKIKVLDSFFIHGYLIIKHRPFEFGLKSTKYYLI